MKLSSFLLGIVLIVGAYEVRLASSSAAAADQVLQTLQLSNCDDLKVRLACFQRKYRTIDGTCNNLCNITRGAANRPLRRLIEPDYEADLQPRRFGNDGFTPLPNPRRVSRVVFRSGNFNLNMTAPNFTHMTMTWGQFIDHDITLTELTPNVECGTNNEPCVVRDGCIGIPLTERNADRLEFNQSAECIPLRRSLISSDGQQLNLITSYIDGSQVYGSDIDLANRLRNSKANLGLLDVEPYINSMGQPRLPDADEEAFCRSTNSAERPCFLAGDVRVNENQALMAMHVIWVREHNRIATYLHVLNPHWNNERLFQEARKIVGAEIQHITYNEWLPVLFDDALRTRSGLLLEPKGSFFTGYDPTVNPEMINSFSTAALRMGHSLIRSNFTLLDRQFRRQGFGEPDQIPTRDFFNPDRFYRTGNNAYGGILLGLMRTFAHQIDPIMSPAVREQLIVEGPPPDGVVGDLSAINMQRGRDHGLPGYAKFREACGGRPAHYFSDIADTVTQQQIERLQNVYDNVKDIDLWAGAMSEFPAPGSALGLTFTHILIEQFRALRVGDRFWYERDDHQTGFTLAQLDQIRDASLARVICDNADGIRNVHPRVFVHRNAANPDGSNDAIDCDDVPFVDLNVFKEGPGMEPGNADGEANAFVGA